MKTHLIIALVASAAGLAGCGAEKPAAAADQKPAAAAAPANVAASDPAPVDPVEEGRKRFTACAVCHTVDEGGAARVGPNLFGVVGKTAGSPGGFAYSKAMADSGVVWTDETLDAFLENPQKLMRGNRMAYAGERNPERRAAIIAYLNTLK